MKIVAFHSLKGGVGKTAAAVNVSFLAAKEGKRTLLVDLDPQGASSFCFRMRPVKGFGRKELLRGGDSIEEGVRASDYEGLDLIPSSLSFRRLDVALSKLKRPETRLLDALAEFEGDFELVVLDCPPGLSALAESVYGASDLVLCPLIPSPLSVESYAKLQEFLDKKGLDKGPLRTFISMFESRKSLHKKTAEELKGVCGKLLGSRIPCSSDVERMGLLREPLCFSKPWSSAAKAYKALWTEIEGSLWS